MTFPSVAMTNPPIPMAKMAPASERILVVYAYSEIAYDRYDSKSNLQFFIDFAINGKHHSYDVNYVIVVNGYNCTVNIPEQNNTYVIARPNSGFDACAWKVGLDYMRNKKGDKWYKYFVLLNASVRGPFIPPYANDKHWTTYFTKFLDSYVKLVGTSICCSKIWPVHIQSMFLVTSQTGLALIEDLLKCGYRDKLAVTFNVEIKMSQAVLKKGFNIASLLKQWEDHDFRDKHRTDEMCSKHNTKKNGDPYFEGAYYDGIDIHPFEVMFFKTNRGVNQRVQDIYSSMMQEWRQNYSPEKTKGYYIDNKSKHYIRLSN
ncbi:unnamed protein product [Owenia fusiformis]|uniref:Uncharacterized protein n=1 Tax=Owenia fusiformis TaxID=6347 RepID=A0A8J1UVS3_OWEFU|nr:unnamed protein product [Owenia fusiformis]